MIIRKREVSFFLKKKHLFYSASYRFNHIQIKHCCRQKLVSINCWWSILSNNIFHRLRNKFAQICENELVWFFYQTYSSTQLVILMSNAVMKGFTNNIRLIFFYFNGEECSIGEIGIFQISNFGVCGFRVY